MTLSDMNRGPACIVTMLVPLYHVGDSEQLRDILCNPHLKNMLIELDKSDDPGKLLQKAMQIPIFQEFADVCLTLCSLRK